MRDHPRPHCMRRGVLQQRHGMPVEHRGVARHAGLDQRVAKAQGTQEPARWCQGAQVRIGDDGPGGVMGGSGQPLQGGHRAGQLVRQPLVVLIAERGRCIGGHVIQQRQEVPRGARARSVDQAHLSCGPIRREPFDDLPGFIGRPIIGHDQRPIRMRLRRDAVQLRAQMRRALPGRHQDHHVMRVQRPLRKSRHPKRSLRVSAVLARRRGKGKQVSPAGGRYPRSGRR